MTSWKIHSTLIVLFLLCFVNSLFVHSAFAIDPATLQTIDTRYFAGPGKTKISYLDSRTGQVVDQFNSGAVDGGERYIISAALDGLGNTYYLVATSVQVGLVYKYQVQLYRMSRVGGIPHLVKTLQEYPVGTNPYAEPLMALDVFRNRIAVFFPSVNRNLGIGQGFHPVTFPQIIVYDLRDLLRGESGIVSTINLDPPQTTTTCSEDRAYTCASHVDCTPDQCIGPPFCPAGKCFLGGDCRLPAGFCLASGPYCSFGNVPGFGALLALTFNLDGSVNFIAGKEGCYNSSTGTQISEPVALWRASSGTAFKLADLDIPLGDVSFAGPTAGVSNFFDPTVGTDGSLVMLVRRNISTSSQETFLRYYDLSDGTHTDAALPFIVGSPIATGLREVRGLTADSAGNVFVLFSQSGICRFAPQPGVFCYFDSTCTGIAAGSTCTAPAPKTTLYKLIRNKGSVSFNNTPVVIKELTQTTQDYSFSGFATPLYLLYRPAQRIYLDWNRSPEMAYDYVSRYVKGSVPNPAPCGSAINNISSFSNPNQPRANLSNSDRATVLGTALRIFNQSGFVLPIIDSTYYSAASANDGVVVRFGRTASIDGAAFDIGCGGGGAVYVGNQDQCNKRTDARIAVFQRHVTADGTLRNNFTPAFIGRTVAHEIGHALGIRHMLATDGVSDSVMDYHYSASAIETFVNHPAQIVEPPRSMCSPSSARHNPMAHLRLATTCDSRSELSTAQLIPGSYDSCTGCSKCPVSQIAVASISSSIAISNLTVEAPSASAQAVDDDEPTDKPLWDAYSFLGDISANQPATLSFPLSESGEIQIVGSIAAGNIDVAFIPNAAANSEPLFNPEQLFALAQTNPQTGRKEISGQLVRFDASGVPIATVGSLKLGLGNGMNSKEAKCSSTLHSTLASAISKLSATEKKCIKTAIKPRSAAVWNQCLNSGVTSLNRSLTTKGNAYNKTCTSTPPPFGLSNFSNLTNTAKNILSANRDQLFISLDDNIQNLSNAADGICLQTAVTSFSACASTVAKEFASCIKNGVSGKSAPKDALLPFVSLTDIKHCLNSDPKSKVAKACSTSVAKKVGVRCTAQQLENLIPGCSSTNLSSCGASTAKCAVCLSGLAGTNVDCDALDDGEWNQSCS